jgi:hypothetical protein
MTLLPLLLGVALAQDPDANEDVLSLATGTSLVSPEDTGADPEPYVLPSPALLAFERPPTLAEGISVVPSGSLLLLRQEDGSFVSRLVPAKAFLMPEPMYDNALVKAKQLDICQPALDAITEETLQMADRTYAALEKCGDQFDVDEKAIEELKKLAQDQEVRALVAEDRLKQARKGQVVAWAITGGVILGATAATAISLGSL